MKLFLNRKFSQLSGIGSWLERPIITAWKSCQTQRLTVLKPGRFVYLKHALCISYICIELDLRWKSTVDVKLSILFPGVPWLVEGYENKQSVLTRGTFEVVMEKCIVTRNFDSEVYCGISRSFPSFTDLYYFCCTKCLSNVIISLNMNRHGMNCLELAKGVTVFWNTKVYRHSMLNYTRQFLDSEQQDQPQVKHNDYLFLVTQNSYTFSNPKRQTMLSLVKSKVYKVFNMLFFQMKRPTITLEVSHRKCLNWKIWKFSTCLGR